MLLLCYCIGYTSNDWSTSVIPLDQYQEKLRRRILSDWEELGLSKEVQLLRGHLQEREREFYQEQLQREIKEKEQIQQYLQQERDEQVQEKAALIQKFNEDTTHLKETKATLEAHIDQLQKELQEGRQLTSRLMKQKGKEVKTDTVSEKDEEIKSLKNKLEEEKKEEKKLRQELQEKVESLQQQLQQFIIPQSGMCVCVLVVDMMCLYCFRFDRL